MKGVWLITICKFETNLLVLHKGQTGIVFGQICLHTSYLHAFNEHAVWNHPSLHKNWMGTFFKEQIAWISKPQWLGQLSCISCTLLWKMAVDPSMFPNTLSTCASSNNVSSMYIPLSLLISIEL